MIKTLQALVSILLLSACAPTFGHEPPPVNYGLLDDIKQLVDAHFVSRSDRAQFGVDEVWAAPSTTLNRKTGKIEGDCDDYAIAVILMLEAWGIKANAARVTTSWGEAHAIALVGDWAFDVLAPHVTHVSELYHKIDCRGPYPLLMHGCPSIR